MKNKSATTLAIILASAILATAESSRAQQPVPPETQITELINDSEELPDTIPYFPGEESGATCIVENGVGYKGSKGLHMITNAAITIAPDPKTWFNAPEVDLTSADGIMFWIATQKALGISLSASSKNYNGRYNMGDEIMVVDASGEVLQTSQVLKKAFNGQRTISLPAGFEGWVIVPNKLSQDGTTGGWWAADVANDSLESLSGLLIWTGGGDFVIDHLSLYQKK